MEYLDPMSALGDYLPTYESMQRMSRSETRGELYLYTLMETSICIIARIQYNMDAVRNYIAYSSKRSCLRWSILLWSEVYQLEVSIKHAGVRTLSV